jgi:hypothetical protein
MKRFAGFLTEQAESEDEGKKLKHLTHVEDHVIHSGNEGVKKAADVLDDTHDKLLGKKSSTKISTKYDGAPSVVFGYHPKNGKFFVGTKSAFNKNPKINYTDKDIEANHGHASGLVDKLKASLKHLPKITPKGGVYQGDLMHTKEDIKKHGKNLSFTPNTITYTTPEDSAHGQAIRHSKLGVVVHTKYEGRGDLEKMHATPNVDRENFKHHPDVHNIDPSLKADASNYSPKEQQKYHEAMGKAKEVYRRMKPDSLDKLKGHEIDLEAHVNDMVRKGGDPSTEGYIKHITNKGQKEIDKVKTEKSKQQKREKLSDTIKHVTNHKKDFDQAFQLHKHLQDAKDVLTNVMAKNQEFEHSIGGAKTGPEGAVAVTKNGDMSKFVNRKQFSRQNFLAGKMQQAKKESQGNEEV